jgi:16S rRNA (cytosine1402-N4)-methyltransferase
MAETPLPHRPVLMTEALAALAIRPDGFYVDATFGRGGHAAAILERLGSAGSLLALDRDPAAGEWARSEFGQDARFRFVQTRFSQLADMIEERGLLGRVRRRFARSGRVFPAVR